jgi:Na+/glutamate symporter
MVSIFWPLHCLSFHLRLVITTLVSFDHCIVCPSIYDLWLPLWYLLTIAFFVLPFTACVITSRKLKDRQYNDQKIPKWWSQAVIGRVSFDHCIVCPSIYSLWLSLWYLLTIALSVLPFTACDYLFGIVWPLRRKMQDRQYNGQKIPKW